MMLPRWFMSLLIWDRILIVLFVIFSAALITGLVILSAPERRLWLQRKLTSLITKLQEITEAMRDDEPYDPSWMKYQEWRETRP